jgi:hypothetical protein
LSELASYLLSEETSWGAHQDISRRALLETRKCLSRHRVLRQRRNSIRHIEIDGVLVANYEAKTNALTQNFSAILGTARENSWGFDIHQLLLQCQRPSDQLTAPFSEEETKCAILSMNRNSAPGPDGFRLSFYRAPWGTVAAQIMDLLHSFHQGAVELERINRSYMVLLPKKQGVVAVDAFRPVRLQNCSVKILAKILTQAAEGNLKKAISSYTCLNLLRMLLAIALSFVKSY